MVVMEMVRYFWCWWSNAVGGGVCGGGGGSGSDGIGDQEKNHHSVNLHHNHYQNH